MFMFIVDLIAFILVLLFGIFFVITTIKADKDSKGKR